MWRAFGKPFLNIKKIFPTKQKYMAQMIDVCKNNPNVKKFIIFGSSITAGCNPWSDIDIYFEMENEPHAYPTIANHKQAFDKWSNFTASGDLLNEIQKNGVVVYER